MCKQTLIDAATSNPSFSLVCQMISKHPYDTWPLHVKLFSKQAVVAWTEALRDAPPMPPGFTCSIELEGVDGKSGEAGTGRQESIDVKDEHFTSTYLSKNTALLATNSPLHCLVCKEEVMNYTTQDALSTALCPSRSCTAVSHITCLSKKFLDSTSASTAFIPRGGTCPSCNTYILWGDIVRGSYRRVAGGVSAVDENILNLAEDELFASDSESCPTPQLLGKKTSKQRIKATTSGTRKSRAIAALSSEGELFDFDDTSTSSHELNATPKKRGRPSKAPLSSPLNQKRKPEAPISTNTPGQKGAPSSLHRIGDLSEGELFDSDLSSAEDAPQKRSQRSTLATTGSSLATTLKAGLGPMVPRERGRPPKVRPTENLPITAHTVSIKRSDPKTLAKKHYSTTTRPNSSSEFFDFETILRDDTVHVPEPSWHRHQETKSSEEPILGGDGDTIGLIHMMSSMSVSSPSPNHQPCYVEISD
ncbi:hypothetical protein H0H87_004206 [Tephrocybe sp. NHM501043]|nr:hypothetical protein H0H87_004206 [Tephrocybe sp. NHM501043]